MRYDDIKDKKVLFFEPHSKKAGYRNHPELPAALEEVINSLEGKEIVLSEAKKILNKAVNKLKGKNKILMMGRADRKIFFVTFLSKKHGWNKWGHLSLILFKFV